MMYSPVHASRFRPWRATHPDIGIGHDIRLSSPGQIAAAGIKHLLRAVGRLLTYTGFRVIADTLREERLQLSSLSGREPYLI